MSRRQAPGSSRSNSSVWKPRSAAERSQRSGADRDKWKQYWLKTCHDHRCDTGDLARLLAVNYHIVYNWVTYGTGLDGDLLDHILRAADTHGNPVLTPEEQDGLLRVFLETSHIRPSLYPRLARLADGRTSGESAALSTDGGITAPSTPSALSTSAARPADHFLVFFPFPPKSHHFFEEILQGITEHCSNFGRHPVVMLIQDRKAAHPIEEYHTLENVAGVIAVACDLKHNDSWIDDCSKRGKPLVLVHDNVEVTDLQGRGRIVLIEEATDGLESLVDHLISKHGCRHLRVLITDYRAERHIHRKRKIEAIQRAAAARGVVVDEDEHVHTVAAYTYDEGWHAASRYLRAVRDGDAVLCLQDAVAHGVRDYLRDTNRPHVLVAGYDNSPIALHQKITSVHQRLRDTGDIAVKCLYRLANDQLPSDRLPLKRELRSTYYCRIAPCP